MATTNLDALTLSGALAVTGAQTFTGAMSVDSVTDTSSGTTGSIHTDGGVGIAKKLYVGTNATVAGVFAMIGTGTIDIGTTGTPLVLTAGAPIVDIYSTCASTSGSTSAQPFYMKSTMTGVAGVGGRACFHLYTDVALGGWANAIKGLAEFGASGRVTGLGSAVLAEITLSAGTSSGTYAPLESEIVLGSGSAIGTSTSFLYCNVTDDSATFNTGGYLFQLGAGIVDTSNGLFDLVNADDIDATAALKIKIGATDYFIPISTTSAFNA